MKVALVGNQNSGKTTLFNLLTGMNAKIGNWPGVTLEKKTGKIELFNQYQYANLKNELINLACSSNSSCDSISYSSARISLDFNVHKKALNLGNLSIFFFIYNNKLHFISYFSQILHHTLISIFIALIQFFHIKKSNFICINI